MASVHSPVAKEEVISNRLEQYGVWTYWVEVGTVFICEGNDITTIAR